MTYALDEKRKTVMRASFARYAGQLNPAEVTFVNPAGGYYSYIAYNWVDTNKDGFIQKSEVLTNLGPAYHGSSVDPAKPTALETPNTLDPNYHANHDTEFILGLDREAMPNLSVGAAFTFRRTTDWPTWKPRIGLTSADYTVASRQTAQGMSTTFYAPNGDKVDASGGGRMLTNRPDYHSTYSGLELSLNKRLSNKWMARVAFSYNNWVEYLDGPGAVQNPTRTDSTTSGNLSGPQVDGGQIAPRSGGSGKGDIFYNAKWQLNANGFYQLPMDFEVGANLFGQVRAVGRSLQHTERQYGAQPEQAAQCRRVQHDQRDPFAADSACRCEVPVLEREVRSVRLEADRPRSPGSSRFRGFFASR